MAAASDLRQVVLVKSLRTQNRFYALVGPDLGWKNADVVAAFPDHIPLGIAYPCLEDGLNDFAVIRTTFETLALFPDDEELRTELMVMIGEARENLLTRLAELRDRIASGQAHFLGTDLQEFKEAVLTLATRGSLRKQLDQMMKLEVFESVAAAEADRSLRPPELTYQYQLRDPRSWEEVALQAPRDLIAACFDDLVAEVQDDAHYENGYQFDRHVFQKFIALMFVNYATTDAMFYGTAKGDYGVSSDREMQETPLYRAVAEALRDREREWKGSAWPAGAAAPTSFPSPVPAGDHAVIGPLTALAEAMLMLLTVDHPRAGEVSRVISRACDELFHSLRSLNVVAPMTQDPIAHLLQEEKAGSGVSRPSARILVAEDNVVNQTLLQRILERRGYAVTVVGTGRAALAALEGEPFDLALMDVQMPEMDGFEATAAIRQREMKGPVSGGARLPIIAVTAYAMKGFREQCLEAGMDDYIAKPIHRRELLALIERWISPHAAAGAAEAEAGGVIDRAAILDRVEGDTDLLRELVAQFLHDSERQLSELREAVRRRDSQSVEIVAHSLRGAVGNFAARAAFEAALRLETMAREGDLTHAGEAYAALEQALARVRPALVALT